MCNPLRWPQGATLAIDETAEDGRRSGFDLCQVSLALPGEYVKFGSVVQMVAPDMPASRGGESGKLGMVLAGLVGEKEVDCIQHFVHGCALSASPLLTPCVRNAFIIHRASRHVPRLVAGAASYPHTDLTSPDEWGPPALRGQSPEHSGETQGKQHHDVS
uniref:Uncharacterized protein n=1 Tax=Timema tahoe TaxID=61484 RepID=A0A7R9FHH0_9NEOP|nr:unnamed protein product [Timema tahoe]